MHKKCVKELCSLFIKFTQNMSKILGHTSGMIFPQEKYIWTYVRTYLVLEVQPPRSPDFSPSDFHLWGHLKPVVNSVQVDYEQAFHQRILYLSNHSQPPLDLWKDVIIHDRACYSEWGIFCAFVVNCGLVKITPQHILNNIIRQFATLM